jgi:hypothetical protein
MRPPAWRIPELARTPRAGIRLMQRVAASGRFGSDLLVGDDRRVSVELTPAIAATVESAT